MDIAMWISVAAAVTSGLSALVALRAARDARRHGQHSAKNEERTSAPADNTNSWYLHDADHGSRNRYQPHWRFHRFATVTPTPIFSFSRWPVPDDAGDSDRRLFDIQAREAHEQQLAHERYLLPLACALVNDTGETAWGTEWTCQNETFLNEDDRGPNRPPRNVAPNDSLLTFERRPPDNTEIVVTWYRRRDRADETRQYWRGVLPTE